MFEDLKGKNIKLNYRIMEVDESNYSFVVRYWTDLVTEDMLATVLDENGNIVRDANGHPVRCQTDFNMNLYYNTHPTEEEVIKIIEDNANAIWFYHKDQIVSGNSPFDMTNVEALKNKDGSFVRSVLNEAEDEGPFVSFLKDLKKEDPSRNIQVTITNKEDAKNTETVIVNI